MLVVFCLLFRFIIVYIICVGSACIMCYCGSVSDHLGPSALINSILFDLILRRKMSRLSQRIRIRLELLNFRK